MRTDKLYPTSGTTNYDFDLTAPFMQLSAVDLKADMGDQYLMGYCDIQHMPACCTPVYFNQTAEELSFLADYSQNYGFGFARWTYDGGAAPGNLYYIDGDDNIVRSWGVDYDFQFINRGEMCRVNANPAVEILVEAICIRSDLYDGVKCTRLLWGGSEAATINNLGGVWLAFTFNDFVDMIKNDTPIINGTYTGGGDASGLSFNITVRPSDFGNGFDPNSPHYVTFDAGNGFYVFFAIEGVRMGGNTPVYHNGTSIPQNIVPFFSVPHNSEKKSIIVPGSYIQSAVRFRYENGSFTAIQNGGSFGYNQATEFVNNVVYGGYNNGVLSVNDIDWSEATLSGQRRNVFFVRNFYGVFLGAGEFRFYSLYTPQDIYNYLCLYHKHTSTPSDNYSSADTVTVFTNSNMPTLRTVSGTLSDMQLDLQPWQYPGIDITVNTFTPTDIPDPGDSGKNLIRFGDITPSEFLFGDISIEKIYFGSSLLYQRFVPEQYVRLHPADRFITEKTSVDDYRIYGPLPSGEIIISVRTPRVKNLLPFPYKGFWQENGDGTWGHYTDSPGNNPTVDSSGVVSTDAGSVSLKYAMVLASNMGSTDLQPSVIVPAGTYTASIRSSYVSRSSGWRPQLEIRAFRVTDTTYELFNQITDYTGSGYNGRITFTVNEPAIVLMSVFYTSSRNFVADTLYPQLEAGSMTEFESVNPATLTTITLPRALEETEYISYTDQKIMPTGTPLVVPKLKTIVGENVIMIENYPRATNTITLTPATKE